MIEASKPENKANIKRLIHYYEDHIMHDPNITLVKKKLNMRLSFIAVMMQLSLLSAEKPEY